MRDLLADPDGKAKPAHPCAYLHYLFTVAPRITDPAQWQQLLPASLDAAYINSVFLATCGRIDGYSE